VDAANHVGQQLRVEVKQMPFGDDRRTIAVAPITVNIYRFPIAQAANVFRLVTEY